jgi:SAM-dependent methyltransferase
MFGGTTTYDYHRCAACGLIYQHPLPNRDTIAGFYPDSYAVYRPPARPYFQRRTLLALKANYGYQHLDVGRGETLIERLRRPRTVPGVVPFVAQGKALDIGCGNGEYLLRLQSIGWQCYGVEFNPTAAALCRSNGLEVFQGDIAGAALPARHFDFVTANHLLEHVPDPHGLMAEIARVTKPGGKVLIRTPNSASLGRRWFGVYWYANDVPRHLMLYSAHNLRLLAAAHGLEAVQVSTPVKPKLVLKSMDYRFARAGRQAGRGKLAKRLAKLYVPAARLAGGDELAVIFTRT